MTKGKTLDKLLEQQAMLEPVLALRASLLRMWADPTSASGSLPPAASFNAAVLTAAASGLRRSGYGCRGWFGGGGGTGVGI